VLLALACGLWAVHHARIRRIYIDASPSMHFLSAEWCSIVKKPVSIKQQIVIIYGNLIRFFTYLENVSCSMDATIEVQFNSLLRNTTTTTTTVFLSLSKVNLTNQTDVLFGELNTTTSCLSSKI
jgi:hypothetical protein